ncbi:MAG TPA: VCBS repeat-containing protein, partial [Gemmataceae bacterium]|nr:VCBS repeat-containing protein [Gemmataceae bacterium]
MSLWRSLIVRRSRLHLYHPFVEALENRNLLSFLPPVSYAVGSTSLSVAVGDFDGDGHLDLAVANYFGANVSVLLGNGDGTFQTAQSYAVGSAPSSLAVGDFDGDGHLDIAVANFGSATVSILLGNGDGTFQRSQSYAAGYTPVSIAVSDFNGDGHLDIVVANSNDGSIHILLGNGDGTFQSGQRHPVGGVLTAAAVGNFNGDGKPDIAVANGDYATVVGGNSVNVLLGNGDGTFEAPQSYPSDGRLPCSVVVGDFDADGHLDLATANCGYYGGANVSVLLGKGDGTFQNAQTYAAGEELTSLAIGDFDQDGHLDLAVAHAELYYPSNGTVRILLGKDDGTFQDAQSYAASFYPRSVAVGDFNGDGFPDLAVAAEGGVSVLLNAADWGGGPAPSPPGRPGPDRPLPSQRPIAPVSALLPASNSEAEHRLSMTFTNLSPSLVQQWQVETKTDEPANPEASLPSGHIFTARHAQDTFFERWGDGVLDGLA